MKREAHEDGTKLLSNKRHDVCGCLCARGQRRSSCMQRSRVPEKWPRLWVGAACLMGRSHYTSLSVKIRSECTSQPGQPTHRVHERVLTWSTAIIHSVKRCEDLQSVSINIECVLHHANIFMSKNSFLNPAEDEETWWVSAGWGQKVTARLKHISGWF